MIISRARTSGHRKLITALLITATAGMLSACETTQTNQSATVSSSSTLDNMLERAANKAAMRGKVDESLAILEKVYKRNSGDPEAAIKYAEVLHKHGRLHRAALVMAPFARDIELKHAGAKTEYAAIQAAMGNYNIAEEFASQAIEANPDYAKAHHIYGIALDAQAIHPTAETAFRRALEIWEGDPAPVLNNLGLNLAAQGKLDEAIKILQQASLTSSQRMEIERNLRIVMALQGPNMFVPDAPRPDHKPTPLND